jgi:hypothetical protein
VSRLSTDELDRLARQALRSRYGHDPRFLSPDARASFEQ